MQYCCRMDTYKPFNMDGDEIIDLLDLWNVSEDIKDNFLRNKIKVSHLQKLKDETLKELCPELGPRLDVKDKIIAYLEPIAITETATTVSETNANTRFLLFSST